MLKFEEEQNTKSCWNKARPTERVFIILGRDKAAKAAINAWVRARIDYGLNKLGDPQIQEALDCAKLMEQERLDIKKDEPTS